MPEILSESEPAASGLRSLSNDNSQPPSAAIDNSSIDVSVDDQLSEDKISNRLPARKLQTEKICILKKMPSIKRNSTKNLLDMIKDKRM